MLKFMCLFDLVDYLFDQEGLVRKAVTLDEKYKWKNEASLFDSWRSPIFWLMLRTHD